ncbi:MAG: penicillin-binding protein activator [Deltaproteobacteria bacterium]|jgi:ABC-type branched-subunit amino acid transport system substrate-binding protein|nr:penicillin-binding protein activator [Deltaproteobacteria bacterium]
MFDFGRSQRLVSALWVLTLSFLLASCAVVSGPGSPSSPSVSGGGELRAADEAFERGDYTTAAAAYRQALAQDGSSPRRETLLGLYALSCERAGNYLQAARSYQELANQYPNSDFSRAQTVRIADLYLLAGRPSEAKSAAQGFIGSVTDVASKAALQLSIGRADYSLGQYRDALVSFILAMSGSSGAVRDEASKGAEASLLNMTPVQLDEVVRQYGQNYPGPEAGWYLARQAAVSGDQTQYRQWADYFQRYFPNHPWAVKLRALEINPNSAEAAPPGQNYDPRPTLAQINPPQFADGGPPALGALSGLKGQVVVGAMLPLSDPGNAKLASFVLSGLRLALANQPNVAVEEMDTAGDPGQTVKLVHEAAARPEVIALVGPLTSREALAAAQTAQAVSMPMIAVSQRLGLTIGRPFVFRIFLTPKHQAEAVARYAIRNLGLERLGALYPNDSYGQGMLRFFQDEVQRLGGQMGTVGGYNPGQSEFTEAVNRLTGGRSVRRASISYQASVDFQALYLPDSASAVAQILPLLAYNDVTTMTFLGSSLWLVPELAQNYGRYMQGSVIPSAVSSLSARPEMVRFSEAFLQATGQPAEQFGAYGYDAGIALRTAFSAGAGSRNELTRALLTLRPFEGATGPFNFGPDGDYQVDPMMLTVDGNAFKLLVEPSQYR